ncbi:CocE/NonD family hydrolase [soil metagenome]
MISAAVVVVMLGTVVVAEQHSYGLRTETLVVNDDGIELSATLALPPGDGPFGIVAFVHGDGPVTADHDGGYLPIWEALASAGYASISWDKPGVGGSEGDWLAQTMQDRADEATAAIAALAEHPELDPDRVALWGASQAGWVLPLIAADHDLDFVVAASPAINWIGQGRYLTETALDNADATARVRSLSSARNEDGIALLQARAPYADYLDLTADQDPDLAPYFGTMSRQRWQFVSRNFEVDATVSLRNVSGVPVLLQLAGRDHNVDVADTERTYRERVADACLTVATYADADHSLVDADIADPRSGCGRRDCCARGHCSPPTC